MKKDFVTAINNANKMYPPLFLTPIEYELQGRKILHIYVPVGTQVSRCSGRIYDRNNESDIDITDNEELVYKLYARKQGTYFVNKVFPEWGIDVLRPDLIERVRKMTRARSNNHPWLSMDDEELLRSAGLILLDHESRKEGITLAAILLFGKDTTIMSALPQHKTDMIFRVQNLDRYDDMRLMRRDFWSGLRKQHKDYRHPAREGCDTYERAFKIVRLKVYHRPIGGIEMVGLIVYR